MDSGSSASCSESRATCIWILGLVLPVVNLGLYMDSGSSAACSESGAVCIWILGLGLPVVNLRHMDSGSRAACESRAACTWTTGLLLLVANPGLPVLYGSRSIAADSESRGA